MILIFIFLGFVLLCFFISWIREQFPHELSDVDIDWSLVDAEAGRLKKSKNTRKPRSTP